MGLFGGGNSSSRNTTNNTTNNVDSSSNLADSTILIGGSVSVGAAGQYTAVDSGGILADELVQNVDNSDQSRIDNSSRETNTVKTGSDNISLAGDNITFQGFSDNAAEVVNNAVTALGSATNGAVEQVAKKVGKTNTTTLTASDSKTGKIVIGIVVAIGGYLYLKKKGKI